MSTHQCDLTIDSCQGSWPRQPRAGRMIVYMALKSCGPSSSWVEDVRLGNLRRDGQSIHSHLAGAV